MAWGRLMARRFRREVPMPPASHLWWALVALAWAVPCVVAWTIVKAGSDADDSARYD